MRFLLACLAMLLTPRPASAYTEAGLKYTSGAGSYAGVSGFAEWGDDSYYLRPAYNTYQGGDSDRRSSYSLGAGLEKAPWRAGAELSLTPKSSGYGNRSLYADLSYDLLDNPAEGAFLRGAGLGVFACRTAHQDEFSLSSSSASGGSGRPRGAIARASVFHLSQTDYGFSAYLKLPGLRAGGRFTKTAYDKDVSAGSRQVPLDIGSIGTSGFPDTAVSASLKATGLPLSPKAGYTRTAYLLDQPASESFTLGVFTGAGPVDISAGWEHFNPGGGSGRSEYYSLEIIFTF